MKIDQLTELQEISAIQARTEVKRTEARAIIVATGRRLVELQVEMGIELENHKAPPSSDGYSSPKG